jgi:hypothetical protein
MRGPLAMYFILVWIDALFFDAIILSQGEMMVFITAAIYGGEGHI